MGDTWRFGYPESPLGGMEDHYIIDGANRTCHPNYVGIPIGNPYGFHVCVKRKGPTGKTLDVVQDPIDPSIWNGYNKYQADMYRPWRDTQIQMYNPYYYSDRRTPHQAELITDDYLHLPIQFNGTGIKPVHTPGDTRFFEYGYSYTPDPPYKYDVQRLIQPYPVWKDEKKFHGYPQEYLDELDRRYNRAKMMGTY